MTWAAHLRLYLLTLAIFLVIDLTWLGVVARGFYRSQLGSMLRADVQWGAAFAFYALYAAGILVFAVLPGLERGEPLRAAALGALLGLVAYAAYDLTNLATLTGFPARLVVVDLVWGTALTGTVAWLACRLARLV
jgi:uncharacterized membrane protein